MVAGYIACLVVGVVMGMSGMFAYFIFKKRTIGNLIVGRSGKDDEPNLFLDLKTNINEIEKLEYATCKVVRVSPNSQTSSSQK